MKKHIAFTLALLFYASILPWGIPSVGAAPKAKFSDLILEGGPWVDVRAYIPSTLHAAIAACTLVSCAANVAIFWLLVTGKWLNGFVVNG